MPTPIARSSARTSEETPRQKKTTTCGGYHRPGGAALLPVTVELVSISHCRDRPRKKRRDRKEGEALQVATRDRRQLRLVLLPRSVRSRQRRLVVCQQALDILARRPRWLVIEALQRDLPGRTQVVPASWSVDEDGDRCAATLH